MPSKNDTKPGRCKTFTKHSRNLVSPCTETARRDGTTWPLLQLLYCTEQGPGQEQRPTAGAGEPLGASAGAFLVARTQRLFQFSFLPFLSPPASPVWHMVGLAEQEEGAGPSAQNPQKTSLRGSWFVQRDRPTAAPCPAPAHAVPASHLRSRRWVNAGEAAVVAGPRPPKPLPCLRAFVLPLSPTRSAFPNMVLPAWPLQRIFC